jgi:hypothetical protein
MIATRSWADLREIGADHGWSILAKMLTIVSAGGYSAAIVASDGQPILVVVPAAVIVSAVIFARPVLGMYLVLSAGLLFEQWGIEGLDPLTTQTHFFENISNYTNIELRLSLSDLLVFVTLVAAVVNQTHGVRHWRGGPLGLPVAAYGASFVLAMGIGIVRGGQWNEGAALAELRGPAYLCAAYFLATNLVRTRPDLMRAVVLLVGLVGVKAFEAMWNAFVMFDRGLRLEAVTSHEDVVFFDVALALALGAVILLGRSRTTYALLAVVPPVIAAELLNQRRVAFVALAAAIAVVSLCLVAVKPRPALAVLAPSAFLLLAYGGVFWNSDGTLAQPIRAVRGIVSPETLSDRDRLSNFWRDIENANIAFTLRETPFIGVGLGQQYFFVAEPPALTGFAYWRYMTHNAIFWVWLKGGILCFFAFWLLVGQAVIASARLVRQLASTELALVALLPLSLIVAQVAFSAVDLGLTYSRCMIVLGVGLGMLATLSDEAKAVEVRPPLRPSLRVVTMRPTSVRL